MYVCMYVCIIILFCMFISDIYLMMAELDSRNILQFTIEVYFTGC
jgi:hypothetical protein